MSWSLTESHPDTLIVFSSQAAHIFYEHYCSRTGSFALGGTLCALENLRMRGMVVE
ncbi:MAG: hypothetical protein ACRCYY_05070 [Trueperaceae bacterium]